MWCDFWAKLRKATFLSTAVEFFNLVPVYPPVWVSNMSSGMWSVGLCFFHVRIPGVFVRFFPSETFTAVCSPQQCQPLSAPLEQNRTIGQDLQTMLCADGLALAQSTLKTFVGYHSSAVWVFGALGCNKTLMQLAEARAKTTVCCHPFWGKVCLLRAPCHVLASPLPSHKTVLVTRHPNPEP